MPGQQVDADQEALVRELMEISGVKAACEHVALSVPGLAKEAASWTDMPYETLHKVFSEVLRPELFYRGVENHLNKNFNRAYCLQALEWLRSPLGRKITQAEVEADLPDSQPRAESYAKQLQRTPPTQRRMELIERLAEATGSVELMAEMFGGFIEGVASPWGQLTADGSASLRKLIRAAAAGSPSLTYPYRALTSEELTKYIQFLESDAGKWCQKTTQEGFKQVWLARAEEAGKQLAKAGAGKGRVTKPE